MASSLSSTRSGMVGSSLPFIRVPSCALMRIVGRMNTPYGHRRQSLSCPFHSRFRLAPSAYAYVVSHPVSFLRFVLRSRTLRLPITVMSLSSLRSHSRSPLAFVWLILRFPLSAFRRSALVFRDCSIQYLVISSLCAGRMQTAIVDDKLAW